MIKRFLTITLLSTLLLPQAGYGFFKPSSDKKVKTESSALLEYENNTISIFKNVSPSVVNVSSTRVIRSGWFFDTEVHEVPAGAGTGFVWDDKGHIVTNYHVIQSGNQGSFTVSFKNDSTKYEAELVGSEPKKDIAVLKLKKLPKNLVPVAMGISKRLQVGQKAVAIGNPFGLDQSISAGIISALGRKIKGVGGVSIRGMIQTDCSINPGNSGGPLLNSGGQVIGMNTMIFSHSGSSAGVGFAVPADTISRIVPELIKHGRITTRPYIGVNLVEDHIARYFGIKSGIIIRDVYPRGPAAKAGLKGTLVDRRGRAEVGDIIIGINDKKIENYDDIYHVLEDFKPGDQVTVKYLRNGKEKKTKLKLTDGSTF